MRQYHSMKAEHPDAVLLFRMGDFYETFYDDAVIASRVLGITLTAREKDIPLAGVPHHSIDNYVTKLLDRGYKVAVCEQVEDPKKAKGLVRREVVKVLTPGTVVEGNLLARADNNFLSAVHFKDGVWGLAFVDFSTGDFFSTEIREAEGARGAALEAVAAQLARYAPKECLMPADPAVAGSFTGSGSPSPYPSDPSRRPGPTPRDGAGGGGEGGYGLMDPRGEELARVAASELGCAVRPVEAHAFDRDQAERTLCSELKVASLEGLGLDEHPTAVASAGAVLWYLRNNRRGELGHLRRVRYYGEVSHLHMDRSTLRNLELFANLRDGGREGTLLEVVDRTSTPMGQRLLRRWLSAPLTEPDDIARRLDAVETFVARDMLRDSMGGILKGIMDLERLMSRCVTGTADARDLNSLRRALEAVPGMKEALEGHAREGSLLADSRGRLAPHDDLVELIAGTLVDEPPAGINDGGMIRAGASEVLDGLRAASRDGKEWMARLENGERERTGIKSLKVKFNRVFGYFIEVTKPHLHLVPDDYHRKQTTSNAERFITDELKRREEMILTADEKINALEKELFMQVRSAAAQRAPGIMDMARGVAVIDAVRSFALVAVANDYTRPVVDGGGALEVVAGRHPVIERSLPEPFVPNDTSMDSAGDQIIILTGPNMAGKSTYLRQVALTVVLAQSGSFVPARKARVGSVDRIFARVGALDDLSRGQSTFMVEMVEVARILNTASHRSLVVLDEMGRGTSTYDGLSLAWAVVEHLHGWGGGGGERGPRTMFATHYHHLNELEALLPRVRNYNVMVKEKGDDIVFLRTVVPGSTDRSYGIQVARLAGLPDGVVGRAMEVLRRIEQENVIRGEDVLNSAAALEDDDSCGEEDAPGDHGEVTGPGAGASQAPEAPGPPGVDAPRRDAAGPPRQMLLFPPVADRAAEEVADRLRELDVVNLTPLDALTEIARLQKMLRCDEKVGEEPPKVRKVPAGRGGKGSGGKARPGGLDDLVP